MRYLIIAALLALTCSAFAAGVTSTANVVLDVAQFVDIDAPVGVTLSAAYATGTHAVSTLGGAVSFTCWSNCPYTVSYSVADAAAGPGTLEAVGNGTLDAAGIPLVVPAAGAARVTADPLGVSLSIPVKVTGLSLSNAPQTGTAVGSVTATVVAN